MDSIFNTGKALFNLQRFQILQTKLNENTSNHIPNAYAYAWYQKLYPLFEENALHEDLEPFFTITKEQVNVISKRADSEWLQKKYYSFYEYEAYFNVREEPVEEISRHTLIAVFRYFYLNDFFDKPFWDKLLEPMDHPVEASSITSEYDSSHIYLM
jgi:lantibiotic modifying enzyme